MLQINSDDENPMKPDELLDLARARLKASDAELARRLHVSRAKVSDYRTGKRPLPDHLAAALASLAGTDPAATLASIHAAQASPETARIWTEIARRAAIGASVIMLVGASPLASTQAYASKTLHNLYIMSSRLARKTFAAHAPCAR